MVMKLLVKAVMPMQAPKPPRPPAPKAPGAAPTDGVAGAIPPTPGKRVKFKHPATGEETEGHIHATGMHGATIVDGHGVTHKVAHGSYMHADGPGGTTGTGPKPSAELVKAAAHKHLELDLDTPLAVHAAAALLVVGGCKATPVHELKSEDVDVEDGVVYVKPDKLKSDEPDLVKAIDAFKKKTPRGPLFPGLTEQSLTAYVKRFGTPHAGGSTGGAPGPGMKPPPTPGPVNDPAAQVPQPMRKATALALQLPKVDQSAYDWMEGEFLCEFRKGRHGLGIITIRKGGLDVPLHEVCKDLMSAKQYVAEQIPRLRRGEAPLRGVFQATA